MIPETVKSYTVRRPGCAAWAEDFRTLADARAEARFAEFVTGCRHYVYAELESGETVEVHAGRNGLA